MSGIIQAPAGGGPALAQFANDLLAVIDRPLVGVTFTIGAEASDTRTFTIQARDRRNQPRRRRVLVLLWLTTPPSPGVTAATVAWQTGEVIREFDTGGPWLVLSDAAGTIVADVTVSGSASRSMSAVVVGELTASPTTIYA